MFLIVLVCIPRFILVLHANESLNYGLIGILMVISAIIPFIFLDRQGLKDIGLCKPQKYSWVFIAMFLGLVFSLGLYLLGDLLYGDSYENWYVYIGKSYNIPISIDAENKRAMFYIMAVSGMIFSPMGEEFFFRGIVHSSFAKSLGEVKASIIDASAFALTHISYFGLVFINNEWTYFTIPTVLWILSMFLLSAIFFICRYKTGSLFGAVVAHFMFNVGMIYSIFYLIK